MATGDFPEYGLLNAAAAQYNIANAAQSMGTISGTATLGGLYGQSIYTTSALGNQMYVVTSNPWVNEPIKEAKKVVKKAFAALMDEITEWHGDVLAV